MTSTHARWRIWTPDEERRLVELYQSGVAIEDIARRLQRSTHAVEVRATKIRRRGTFASFGPRGRARTWTTDEERRLIELYRSGSSFKDICRRLGRSRDSVSWRASEIRRRGVFVPYAPYPPRKKRA